MKFFTVPDNQILVNYLSSSQAEIKSKLVKLLNDRTLTNDEIIFVKRLITDLKSILGLKPNEMEVLMKYYSKKFRTIHSLNVLENGNKIYKLSNDVLRHKLSNKFSYRKFRSDEAFNLVSKLDYRVCPYCNYNLLSKDVKQQKLLFQIDHYYSQEDFPYFSRSFYNLVPSCGTCNHTKRKIFFSISSHYHPYHIEGSCVHDDCIFQFDVKSYNEFTLDNSKKLELIYVLKKNRIKAYKHLTTFNIIGRIKDDYDSIIKIVSDFEQYKNIGQNEEIYAQVFTAPVLLGYKPYLIGAEIESTQNGKIKHDLFNDLCRINSINFNP